MVVRFINCIFTVTLKLYIMSYRAIEKSDFNFKFTGHGHYKVTYFSPKTNNSWSRTTTDMHLIDLTKNEDYPKKKDLQQLKSFIKSDQ